RRVFIALAICNKPLDEQRNGCFDRLIAVRDVHRRPQVTLRKVVDDSMRLAAPRGIERLAEPRKGDMMRHSLLRHRRPGWDIDEPRYLHSPFLKALDAFPSANDAIANLAGLCGCVYRSEEIKAVPGILDRLREPKLQFRLGYVYDARLA